MTARTAEQRWLAWQTVDTGRLVLTTVTSALVVVALARMAVNSVHVGHGLAIAFGLYIAFGELLRLALPGGREAAPIAMSAALCYAMVLTVAGAPGTQPQEGAPPPLVVVVPAGGMVLGSLRTSRPDAGLGSRACPRGSSPWPASRSYSTRWPNIWSRCSGPPSPRWPCWPCSAG
jgi:hypothetical protein